MKKESVITLKVDAKQLHGLSKLAKVLGTSSRSKIIRIAIDDALERYVGKADREFLIEEVSLHPTGEEHAVKATRAVVRLLKRLRHELYDIDLNVMTSIAIERFALGAFERFAAESGAGEYFLHELKEWLRKYDEKVFKPKLDEFQQAKSGGDTKSTTKK